MNRDCHERLANRWRRKRRSLLLPVKLLTTLVFLSVLAGLNRSVKPPQSEG